MLAKHLSQSSRQDIIEALRQPHPTTITFRKKDGTLRLMKCTLNESLMEGGGNYEKKTDRTKEVNENVVPVYDLDAKSWRSFRIDSLESMIHG